MEKTAKTLALSSVALLALVLACPAPADDFKLGFGGGATFPSSNYSKAYKTGWDATARALWIPSVFFVGVRVAGYYGQNAPKVRDIPGFTVKDSALYGGDLNAAIRLVGEGANGLYVNGGIGVRSLRQEFEAPTFSEVRTDTKVSYNGGVGISAGWFFTEANAVYFKINDLGFWSFPVNVGFQF